MAGTGGDFNRLGNFIILKFNPPIRNVDFQDFKDHRWRCPYFGHSYCTIFLNHYGIKNQLKTPTVSF